MSDRAHERLPSGTDGSGQRTGDDSPAPDQAPRTQSDILAEIQATLAQIGGGLGRLENHFEARLAYDATKEAAFQRLYADLQDAKLAQSLMARPLKWSGPLSDQAVVPRLC